MPPIETILLIAAVFSAGLGGLFSRFSPGMVAVMVTAGYFIAGFFLFSREEPLWFVTLMMGMCVSGVAAMVASFAGRALSKLLPNRRD